MKKSVNELRDQTRKKLESIGFYPTEPGREIVEESDAVDLNRTRLREAIDKLAPSDLFALTMLASSLIWDWTSP